MGIEEILNYVQYSDTIATSGQPLIQHFPLIASAGYSSVINLSALDSENSISNEQEIVYENKMIYIHIPVPFQAPTVDHVRIFFKTMASMDKNKVWVHCVKNYRTTAFMYIYERVILRTTVISDYWSIFEQWKPDAAWRRIMDLKEYEI